MKRGFRPPLVYRQVRRQVLHLTPPQALILSFIGLSLVGTAVSYTHLTLPTILLV